MSTRPAPSGGGPLVPQLDALRGLAILAVFTQHLGDRFLPLWRAALERGLPGSLVPWALTIVHHAWWGVDLFFVVSGFSLGASYVRAYARPESPAPGAARFFLRRAARILPAYAVALAVALFAHRAIFASPDVAASLLAHALLLQGYVTPGGLVLIGATWSLTTEAHFYLLLPVFARPLLTRSRPLRAAVTAAALIGLAWLVRGALHAAVLEPGVHTAVLELTQRRLAICRLDQFVLGASAALAHELVTTSRHRARAARLAPFGLVASLALLVVAFRLEGALYLEPGGSWPYALMSLATAGLVLWACLSERAAARAVAPEWLRSVGVVSYGVFLFHELALGLVGSRVPMARGDATWSTLAFTAPLALAASLGAGLASWKLVELPALRWAARRGARPARSGT